MLFADLQCWFTVKPEKKEKNTLSLPNLHPVQFFIIYNNPALLFIISIIITEKEVYDCLNSHDTPCVQMVCIQLHYHIKVCLSP